MRCEIENKKPEVEDQDDYDQGFEDGYLKGCEDTKQIILQTQAFLLMPAAGSA